MTDLSAPDGYAGLLRESASQWPTAVALEFEDATWTYAEFNDAVHAAAQRISSAGIGPGTRVLLLMENRPEYLIAQFAVNAIGAVFVTPNPYWTDHEIGHAVTASEATAAIYEPRFTAVVRTMAAAVPADDLLSTSATHVRAFDRVPTEPAYIPFSSGTTGLPKGVVHSDASLCGGVRQLQHHLELTTADRLQLSLPLCHIFGATMSAAAISAGARMTLFRRFDLDDSLDHIETAGVTLWPLAGAVAYRLGERADLETRALSSLRFFMWGGSAVPTALARTITERTGVRFLCSYGMTEAMMVAFNPVGDPAAWALDSPGYPTVGTEVRIADDGELHVRGASVASGYAGAQSDAFVDGWFRTGDRVTRDHTGRLHVVDRIKDMLKVSGFQVSPVEIEQTLLQHPGVADVGVVGRDDPRTGEAPIAFVVTSGDAISGQELTEWLTARLATYKRPREYRFVDSLPRTSGGKLRRVDLRGLVSDGTASAT